MFMPSNAIQVKVVGCTGTILLNRPEQANALTRSMIGQLVEALDDLYLEKRVRAIIITGAGEAFSHGRDVPELHTTGLQARDNMPASTQQAALEQWGDDAMAYRDLLIRMLEITKPIIAAVNGPALSEGAGLVVASDLVVASHEAHFGLPEPRRGLVAGVVAPLLSFRLGAGQSARLLLTSDSIGAHEAHRLGLFHELVKPDQVWARAVTMASQCAAGAPEAIQLTKRLLNETIGELLSTQLSAGAAMSATAHTTAAAREGIAAHLENRPPEWED